MNKPDSEIGVYSSDKRVYNHERSFYKSLVPLILAKEECVVASIEHDDLPSVLLVLGHLSYYVSCWKIRGGGGRFPIGKLTGWLRSKPEFVPKNGKTFTQLCRRILDWSGFVQTSFRERSEAIDRTVSKSMGAISSLLYVETVPR